MTKKWPVYDINRDDYDGAEPIGHAASQTGAERIMKRYFGEPVTAEMEDREYHGQILWGWWPKVDEHTVP